MSLQDETTRIQYICDGSTFEFEIPFTFERDEHVKVELKGPSGNTAQLIYGDEYIVVNNEVTTTGVYASGNFLTVYRDTERTQETELEENTRISAEVSEKDMDKGARIDQEQKTQNNRVLRFPISDDDVDELPAAEQRKGTFLMFDSITGQPRAVSIVFDDTVTVSPYMKPVLESEDADEFRELAEISSWHIGTDVPASTLGIDGDFYYREDLYEVYYKSGGTWSLIADFTYWQGSARTISDSPPDDLVGSDGDFWFRY